MAQTERDRLLSILGILTGDRVMSPAGQALARRMEFDADTRSKLEQQTYDRGQDALKADMAGRRQQYDQQQDAIKNDLAERRLRADQEQAAQSREDRLLAAADRLQAARDRASSAQVERDGRAEDRANTNRDRALERLTKTLDTQGYSELHQSLGALNNVLGQYPEGKNIPGIGGAANMDKFGIGTGLTYLPGGGGSAARNNQSTAAAVKNAILKARSGGAVTAPEADRLLNELSQGVFSGDKDFRAAIGRIGAVLNAKIKNVFAGYPADVVSEYYNRGGQVRELKGGTPGQSGFSAVPVQ